MTGISSATTSAILTLNDSPPSTGIGQYYPGNNLAIIYVRAGNYAGSTLTTAYIGILYTSQYRPAEPTVVIGSELSIPSPSRISWEGGFDAVFEGGLVG